MNSLQIECFISAAETFNFTKTAKLLYISQPTVTHHITALENELGYELFDRINKQVILTPAGKYFYKSMKTISSDFNNAVLNARKYGEGYKKELVIGCGSSEFEEEFLPDVIQQFTELHRDIYISFRMNPIREKMALLQEEKIDVLFSTTKMNNDTSRFEYIPLRSYPMVCVMSRDNKLADLSMVSLDDLGDQNIILLDQNYAPPEMDELQKQVEKRYQANIIQYLSNVRMSHLIILCNMGIAIMPEFKYLKNDKLIAVPFEWKEKVSYGISVKKGVEKPYVKEFIRMTKFVFEEPMDKIMPKQSFESDFLN